MVPITHYIEIAPVRSAFPDEAEDLLHFEEQLLGQLFSLSHRHLIPYRGRIGIGFPDYCQNGDSLSGRVRFFGVAEELTTFIEELDQSLKGIMEGYYQLAPIEPIPTVIDGYCQFYRVRKKGLSDMRRLKRRYEERDDWCEQLAKEVLTRWRMPIREPYIEVKSHSNQQRFSLWVGRKSANDEGDGGFNAYGLSQHRALPSFE